MELNETKLKIERIGAIICSVVIYILLYIVSIIAVNDNYWNMILTIPINIIGGWVVTSVMITVKEKWRNGSK